MRPKSKPMQPRRFYALIFLGLLLGGVAWARVQTQRARALPPEHQELSVVVGGLERRYLLYVPPDDQKARPLPLVIMLHGMGGTALNSLRETGWSDKANEEGFIVVYPEATRPDPSKPPSLRKNPQAWNDGSGRFHAAKRNVDDVAFVKVLIDLLGNDYAIDPKRIYITGFSNGSSMAFRLGAELADRVAAIAPHSGTCWMESLPPSIDISVCYLTGSADTLNPIEGGFPKLALGGKDQGGRPKPAVMAMINKWCKALDCGEVPNFQETESGIHTLRFGPGRNASELVCITIDELGHHWAGGNSQAPEFLVGKNTDKLKATDVVWGFFAKHPYLASRSP